MLKFIFLTGVGVCSSAAIWLYAHGHVPGVSSPLVATETSSTADAPLFSGAAENKGSAFVETPAKGKVPPPILGAEKSEPFPDFAEFSEVPPAGGKVARNLPRSSAALDSAPRLELPRGTATEPLSTFPTDSERAESSFAPFAIPDQPPADLRDERSKLRNDSPRSRASTDLGDDIPDLAQRPFADRDRFASQSRTTPAVPWQKAYESTQRRPIETVTAGVGKVDVVTLGSLHGDEPYAPWLVERLAEEVITVYPPQRVRNLFVRTPNPDGLARRTRTNSRSIDLNRSFPRAPQRLGGLIPTSAPTAAEFETRAVQRMMQDYGPRRVIHLKTTGERNGWMICNQLSRGAATALARRYGFRLYAIEITPIPGSLEEYLTASRIEVITIAVPVAGQQPETIWQRHREMLLTASGINPAAPIRPMSPALGAPQPGAPGNNSLQFRPDSTGSGRDPSLLNPNRPGGSSTVPQRPVPPRGPQFPQGPVLQGPTSSRGGAPLRGPSNNPGWIELGAPEAFPEKNPIPDTARQAIDATPNSVGKGFIELPPAP